MVRGCISEGIPSQDKQEKPSILVLKAVTVNPVELSELFRLLDGNTVKSLFDTGVECCFISDLFYNKYFRYKECKYFNPMAQSAKISECVNTGVIELHIEIR